MSVWLVLSDYGWDGGRHGLASKQHSCFLMNTVNDKCLTKVVQVPNVTQRWFMNDYICIPGIYYNGYTETLDGYFLSDYQAHNI